MGQNEFLNPYSLKLNRGEVMARNGKELKLTAFATGPWRVFQSERARRSDSATFRNQLKSANDRFYQLSGLGKCVFTSSDGELA